MSLRTEFNTVFGSADIYRRLVENLHAGVYIADEVGNLVYVNQAFVTILGYSSKDEVIGLNLAKQLYAHPDDQTAFMNTLEKTGFVCDYELQTKRKDGRYVTLSVTSSIIYGECNQMVGVQGVVHDVTEYKRLSSEMSLFKNTFEQTVDHVMITDKEGTIQYVNTAFEKSTGYHAWEVIGKTPRVLKSGKHDADYYKKLWATLLSGQAFAAKTTNRKKNGMLYVADQTISPVFDQNGQITNFIAVWKDATDEVKVEERLRNECQRLEEVIGFDEKISAVRKSEKLLDFTVTKVLQIFRVRKCSIFLVDKERDELCLKAQDGFADVPVEVRIKIGGGIYAQVVREGRSVLIADAQNDLRIPKDEVNHFVSGSFMMAPIKRDGEVIGLIGVADKENSVDDGVFNDFDLKMLSDVAREVAVAIENVRFYKELKYLTMTDPMTGLYNFRYFNNSLDYEIKRLKRIPGDLSIVMIDVDYFKSYNDTFGHQEGNVLLKKICQTIQNNLRNVDIFCRYAGDEFVIILPGTDKAGSLILAEKVRKLIEERKFRKPVTITIGVAQHKNGMTAHELVCRADRALYRAKNEGRNKVCVF